MKRALLSAALILAGCATETTVAWHWANAPEQAAFRRDDYECTREATYTRGIFYQGSGGVGQGLNKRLYVQCMESKGYVRECPAGSHWNDDRDKCKEPR